MLGRLIIHDGKMCLVGSNITSVCVDDTPARTEKYPYTLYDYLTYKPVYTATEEYVNSCETVGSIIPNEYDEKEELKEVALALLEKYKHEASMLIEETSTHILKDSEELQREYEWYLDKINNIY